MIVAISKKEILVKDTEPSDYHDGPNSDRSEYELNCTALQAKKEVEVEFIYKDTYEFIIPNYRRKFKMMDFDFYTKTCCYTPVSTNFVLIG